MSGKEMSSEDIDKMTIEEEENLETEEPEVEETEAEETEAEETEAEDPEEMDLAEEALELTDDGDAKPKKDELIGDITALRSERRGLRQDIQLLTQQLQERNAPPADAEKSPVELEAEKQGIKVSEIVMDYDLYERQKAFEKKQEQKQAQQQHLQRFNEGAANAERTMTDELYGEGLGIESLKVLGEHLLTKGDMIDVYEAGTKCGEVLMRKLKYRILETGGKGAQLLRARLKARKTRTKPETVSTVKTKTKTTKAQKTKIDDEDESGIRASTAEIMKDLEL